MSPWALRQAELESKVGAYGRIANSSGSFCITSAAKDLQVRSKDLQHKVNIVTYSGGSGKVVAQVRVIPKGLAKQAATFNLAEAG